MTRTATAAVRAAATSDATRVGVGILGATGYSGIELLRLLRQHPHADVLGVHSRQHGGETLSSVWPGVDTPLVLDGEALSPRDWRARGIEVVFAALPHGAFATEAEAFLQAGLRVVDLSSDFRLRDAGEYRRRYGTPHPAPHLLGDAAYGLAEWCEASPETARLVANPGCYATAILLAALPAVAAGTWSGAPIVANALSGVSGAGRGPSLKTHFVECGSSAAPYNVGEAHAHLGEIGQTLAMHGGGPVPAVVFNPHLVPMPRGILASLAIPLARRTSLEEAREIYTSRYAGKPFVNLMDGERLPETRHVLGSNRCDLALRVAAGGTMLLAFAAIDNLGKGAAGQAIQNWNRMQSWPDTTGLPRDGWTCA